MTSIVEFRMPKFGETMEKGKVVAWKKSVGEKIDKGESIVEIETDKANLDVIVEILIPAGSTEEINTVLARISTTDK